MKKVLSKVCCLMISGIVLLNILPTSALANYVVNYSENRKQEEIDILFSELNELALDMKLGTEKGLYSTDNLKKQTEIENELFERGVVKIDPTDSVAVEQFAEITLSSANQEGVSRANTVFDFDMIANVYSIYDYSGTYTINGETYDYEYYRVVDNKGYVDHTLTYSELLTPIGRVSTTIGALLEYNFSYGMSAFLGVLPAGSLLDWGLGNIWAALESYSDNTPVVFSDDDGIYAINIIAVTSMTYYYIKDGGTWYNCGSRANDVSFARVDSMTANIDGEAFAESEPATKWNSSAGHSWYWYLEEFIENNRVVHNSIGSIDIYKDDELVGEFEPVYVRNPYGLI